MKNVTVTGGPHPVVKTWVIGLGIFFLVVTNFAFKIDNEEKKTSSESVAGRSDIIADLSANTFDPARPYAQLNPRVLPFVKKYIKEEGERLDKMKVWGKKHFAVYDRVLSEYDLPLELKYLSVVESDLTSKAFSKCGAVGPWQIMKEEAKSRGLKVNSEVDERTSYRKSTIAAAKILRDLYAQFHDWTLVIAAYNCGDGRVRQAIRKSGSKNFWHMAAYLPPETRGHVKRFMATHYIFEGSGGLTTLTASEIKHYDSKVVTAMQLKQFQLCDEVTTDSAR